ncbi:helix-turn-helix domain-containing protein [Vulcanococcus limneticus]|uniref:helix-turn-helix domain-containing protein n=1 Tax=Vulcanococcus limneticus TaxID=2170428 RepID=UPI00398BC7C3
MPIRHRKLTPELIERAARLTAAGASNRAVAAACGVSRQQFSQWLNRGRRGGTPLEQDLSDAMQESAAAGEIALLQRIIQASERGDTRASRWLLTHSPSWRSSWAEASGLRRAMAQFQADVAAAIEATALSPAQRIELLAAISHRLARRHAWGHGDGA